MNTRITILAIVTIVAAVGLVTAALVVPAQAKVRAKLFCGEEESGTDLCAQDKADCQPFKDSGFIQNCHAVPLHQ